MYPFLHRRARYSFYPLLLALAASLGCSSTPPPTSLSLAPDKLEHLKCTPLSKHMSAIVYRCVTDSGDGSGDIFVSSLKDCSINEKFTFQATTRQLFVGLVGLKVVWQEPVKLGSTPALQSVVQGALDADPIIMSTFTFRQNSCVTDLVFWKGNPQKDVSEGYVSRFTADTKTLADSLITENLLAEDISRVAG